MTRTKKTIPDMPNLTRTVAALAALDVADQKREAVAALALKLGTGVVESGECGVRLLLRGEQKVREAFADDTADRNSRENAMLVNPNGPFMRRLVNSWKASRSTG